LDNASDISRVAKYSHFLGFQHSGILRHAINSTHDVGSVWYTADQRQSQWSPQASVSGLEAFISAAKHYFICKGPYLRSLRTLYSNHPRVRVISIIRKIPYINIPRSTPISKEGPIAY
jgi:hypothetical protein